MAFDAFPPVLAQQAQFCRDSGSPFTAAFLEAAAADIAAEGPISALVRPWAEAGAKALIDDAVSLRLAGGFHHAVLRGDAPALAAFYPPGDPAAPGFAAALADAAREHRGALSRFMGSPPQTNEVLRAMALLPGFLAVAGETGLPLTTLEIGASAGLNLNWARFHYRAEGWAWGDPASPVRLHCDWRGPPPAPADPGPVEALGCDVAPVDVGDPAQALRLRAYVWPDQSERMARLQAAIGLALRTEARPEPADAAAWLRHQLHPRPGRATVLYHSVVRQYLSPETAAGVDAALAAAARNATPAAPVAWLRMEPQPGLGWRGMEVRLTLWPGGEERLLAVAHPHGAWVEPA